MPTAPDQSSFDQDLLNLDSHQESPPRRTSPSRKSQGKYKKKHEKGSENAEQNRTHKHDPGDITSQPSILSQLRLSPPASQADLTSNLDPSLEAYSDPVPEPRSDALRHSTAEWARSVPYGRSPPEINGRSVAGSPPGNRASKGRFSHATPPTSPRSAKPVLAQRSNEFQSLGGVSGVSPPQISASPAYSGKTNNPPPPHFPQAHFYGAPDLDFGQAGQGQSHHSLNVSPYCMFDSVRLASNSGSVTSQDVLLVGRDYALDVYHIHRKHLVHIGRLSKLRGSVISAKVIPSNPTSNLAICKALVAVEIHGPCIAGDITIGPGHGQSANDEFDPSESMIQALQTAGTDYWQTTVEIHTLNSAQHLTTLFASPKLQLKPSRRGSKPSAPPPYGKLAIQARGSYITISSGVSGEILIYECNRLVQDPTSAEYHCIGKTWTGISAKRTRSSSVSSRESEPTLDDDEDTGAADQPIASLGTRWLAFVPPGSPQQTTIHARILETEGRRIPGLSSHVAPEPPQTTCQVETPEAESLINRMARDATQEVFKGARWVGSQGIQAWNRYWAKDTDVLHQGHPTSSRPVSQVMQPPPHQCFPPTHAQENPSTRAKHSPALVSILDLEKLSQSQHLKESVALQPITTFALPNGCSAMSFAPSGTQLFTASAKGDTQQIWDMMRLLHGDFARTSLTDTPSIIPVVREVARFTRMTEARIINVAWTRPNGKKLAVATENGTVHVFNLPSSAFYWPPLRRTRRAVSVPSREGKLERKEHERGHSEDSNGALGSAFGILAGRTQPLFSAMRGRTASAGNYFPGFGGFTAAAGTGAKGGKAVAAGINRSFTAAASGTVNTIRHLGDNRISLPGPSRVYAAGCVRWTATDEDTLLAVTGSGVVRLHGIHQSSGSPIGKRRPSAVDSKFAEIAVPNNVDDTLPHHDAHEREPSYPGSFWLPADSRPSSRNLQPDTHPLSYAEIETHAPYQPFHTDRRVTFHVYTGAEEKGYARHLQGEDPWAFGEEIPATRLTLSPTSAVDDDLTGEDGGRVEMENVVRRQGNAEEGQQIVVSTRRKRQKKGDLADEDDREFFEDDLEMVDFAHDRV